jgi:exosortase H (IPTLxxWG-CTERM-specific)
LKKKTKSALNVTGHGTPKRSILRFGLTVVILMGLFYAYIIFDPLPSLSMNRFFHFYQNLNADISGSLLAYFGHDIRVTGDTISSPDFSVNLRHGCDAVEPTALFVFAVLAFPAPLLRKIPGVVAGVLLLANINVVRIISLFLTGVYFPDFFHTMHVDVWQALFIFFAVVLWVVWALWAGKMKAVGQNAEKMSAK